mmetsp:Transcript_40126/g.95176  ORF Transcript_40126/g.95176 Transcript_40126/m.95176 type:complete len:318 (-) Transcript_40126:238-1191(-)
MSLSTDTRCSENQRFCQGSPNMLGPCLCLRSHPDCAGSTAHTEHMSNAACMTTRLDASGPPLCEISIKSDVPSVVHSVPASGGDFPEWIERRSITAAVMLSLPPFCSANSTRALAALVGSPNLCTTFTAVWEDITSHSPSEAIRMYSSPGERSQVVTSGSAMTHTRLTLGAFMDPSPKVREVASRPLTRGMPVIETCPPELSMRFFSSGRSGLWSVDMLTAAPRRESTVRESPTFATYARFEGAMTTVVAVDPSCIRCGTASSRKILSTSLKELLSVCTTSFSLSKAQRCSEAPTCWNSFAFRNSAHFTPECPSNTP